MPAKFLKIHGRVQEVFFRATAKEIAEELGVAGWVRNQDDGTVEIHVEGEEEKVVAYIRWAHHGPAAANVEKVDEQDVLEKEYATFEIESDNYFVE